MRNSRWLTTGIIVVIMLVMAIGYGGLCSKSKDKDKTTAASSAPAATSVIIIGELDGTTAEFVGIPHNGFFDNFCKLFSLPEAYAGTPNADISKIYSITYDQTGLSINQAITNGNSFSLSLRKGLPYIIVFVGGTTNVLGLLKLDAATDLDTLPLSSVSGNINLGTIRYSGTEFAGDISQADLLNAIGITTSVASACGTMDNGMKRWCSMDVDQDQVLDFTQNRDYQLSISYQFRSPQMFEDITMGFSTYTQTVFTGYQYNFSIAPREVLLGFGDDAAYEASTATMHSPADINGGNNKKNGFVGSDPWAGGGNYAIYEFYSGEPITDPSTPPQGTYVITITDSSVITTKVYTVLNMESQTIISPSLVGVYIPSVKLTMVGEDRITKLEWKWWKYTGTEWVNPTAEELDAVMSDSTWALSTEGNELRGNIASPYEGIPFKTEGSIDISQTGYSASSCSVNYFSKSGFEYHFEWTTPD